MVENRVWSMAVLNTVDSGIRSDWRTRLDCMDHRNPGRRTGSMETAGGSQLANAYEGNRNLRERMEEEVWARQGDINIDIALSANQRKIGNFPQAFTRLSPITACYHMIRH